MLIVARPAVSSKRLASRVTQPLHSSTPVFEAQNFLSENGDYHGSLGFLGVCEIQLAHHARADRRSGSIRGDYYTAIRKTNGNVPCRRSGIRPWGTEIDLSSRSTVSMERLLIPPAACPLVVRHDFVTPGIPLLSKVYCIGAVDLTVAQHALAERRFAVRWFCPIQPQRHR